MNLNNMFRCFFLVLSSFVISNEITFQVESNNGTSVNLYRVRIDYLFHNFLEFHLFCKSYDSNDFHYVASSPMGEMYKKIFVIAPHICAIRSDDTFIIFDINCKKAASFYL